MHTFYLYIEDLIIWLVGSIDFDLRLDSSLGWGPVVCGDSQWFPVIPMTLPPRMAAKGTLPAPFRPAWGHFGPFWPPSGVTLAPKRLQITINYDKLWQITTIYDTLWKNMINYDKLWLYTILENIFKKSAKSQKAFWTCFRTGNGKTRLSWSRLRWYGELSI